MNPISGYFCSRCRSPTITLRKKRSGGRKEKLTDELHNTSVEAGKDYPSTMHFSAQMIEPDFILPRFTSTGQVICHINFCTARDVLKYKPLFLHFFCVLETQNNPKNGADHRRTPSSTAVTWSLSALHQANAAARWLALGAPCRRESR